MPRVTASYGDADAQPSLPPRLWWRLVELLNARGELSPYARRMAKHVTHHATPRGRISGVEESLIPGYKGRYGIGRRSAYTDLGRLVDAGLLRQVHAACPGRGVAYQLCVPERLPADLPASLARELRKRWARPSKAARAAVRRAQVSADAAVRVASPLAEQHRLLAGCEAVRLGASSCAVPETEPFRGSLHTSPLLKRALPQPLRRRSAQGSTRSSLAPMGQILGDETGLIADVIHRCMALWGAEHAPGRLPDGRALHQLRPLLRSALRWYTSADVIEALTSVTRSARDLAAVAATRLRRMIISARRAAAIPADEDGTQYDRRAAEAAQVRADLHERTTDIRAQARAAAEAARDRRREHPHGRPRLRLVPPPAPPTDHTPPPSPVTPDDLLDPADLALLRQAMANAATGTPRL